MNLLLLLLMSFAAYPGSRDVRTILEQTFPRDNTYCTLNNKKVRVHVRGESKYTIAQDTGFGEYAFYTFDKDFSLLPLNADHLDSFQLFRGSSDTESLCSKSLGFALPGNVLAVLFLEENGPLGNKLAIQPIDMTHAVPLEAIETNYITDSARPAPNGFYFKSISQRLEMDMGKVMINGKEYLYQDRPFPTWILYTTGGFSVQPTVTFQNFTWNKHFKNEAEFLTAANWDATKKAFTNDTIYYAINREVKTSCVLLVNEKRKLTEKEDWHCISD